MTMILSVTTCILTYSRNSTYFTNLKTLLSSLSSRNASYSTGFQTATAGQAPDRVTGLFLCRGDVSQEVCRNCVAFSVKETLYWCPYNKEVVLYYDECMLRYSHRNILSTVTYDESAILLNGASISSSNQNQVDEFRDLVSSTLNLAAVEAANSSKKFYTRKVITPQPLYLLVQCTPDLTRQDCLRCLQKSIKGMSLYTIGGRFLYPSCNSRYETYSFYNETATRSSSPPSLPPRSTPQQQLKLAPPPLISERGKGRNSSVIIVVVVPIIALLLLFVAFFSLRAKKTRTNYEREPLTEESDDITTAGSLQFDFKAIEAATNKFCETNKLGQGGFGEVYKGIFPSGVQVAVKRLSKTSGQGEREFTNEVVVVAKLQHRNLTWRLWSNGSPLELVDPSFRDNYRINEVSRCIHIALLCVQEEAEDRPTMSAIVQMLTTSSIALAVPQRPGFFFRSSKHEQVGLVDRLSINTSALCSVDDASITNVTPR
ncbi:unnamed protein product [Arabidopsis thaliana]|uniref:(thale cress) hypothetical protein n=1 Tax=Arabidopsis thaliana TaxID=3702 RepID=A0A7G2ESY0_ARATH|nr:unnamed protein product [Arabidopsis thaliana]